MNITCHHCKTPMTVPIVSGRPVLAFRESCSKCSSDLHICHNCTLYDAGSYHECRESSAEWVKDKERANRCEYFTPKDSSATDTKDNKPSAKSALDDLFK